MAVCNLIRPALKSKPRFSMLAAVIVASLASWATCSRADVTYQFFGAALQGDQTIFLTGYLVVTDAAFQRGSVRLEWNCATSECSDMNDGASYNDGVVRLFTDFIGGQDLPVENQQNVGTVNVTLGASLKGFMDIANASASVSMSGDENGWDTIGLNTNDCFMCGPIAGNWFLTSYQFSVVPEPSSIMLLLSSIAGLSILRRRRPTAREMS